MGWPRRRVLGSLSVPVPAGGWLAPPYPLWGAESTARTKLTQAPTEPAEAPARRQEASHEPSTLEEMRRFVGSSMRRVEDGRLLRGRGRFVDDLRPFARTHDAAIVRGPDAHARVLSVDRERALRFRG